VLYLRLTLSAAVWPQFWMQSCFLQSSLMCAKLPHRIHSVDRRVRYSSVTISCMVLQAPWEIAFLPRSEVGRWPSDIG